VELQAISVNKDTEVPQLKYRGKKREIFKLLHGRLRINIVIYYHRWFVMGLCKTGKTCRHTDWTWRQKTKHWPRNEGRKDNHDPVEITMQHCIIETTVQVLPSAHGLSKQINLLSQRKTVPLCSTASLDPWKHCHHHNSTKLPFCLNNHCI